MQRSWGGIGELEAQHRAGVVGTEFASHVFSFFFFFFLTVVLCTLSEIFERHDMARDPSSLYWLDESCISDPVEEKKISS